jgi:hypothetical protein
MTDCIVAPGARTKDGYVLVRMPGTSQADGQPKRRTSASRAAWINAYGPIPDDLFVCHRCDNPPCVRLDHLFLGTALDNNRDRAVKGRSARNQNPLPGEANGRARLTWDQVQELRDVHAREGRRHGRPRLGVTRKELAMRFGVSVPAIDAILSGRNWKGGDASIQSFRRSASSGQGLA